MSSFATMNLKNRITQMLWIGNAVTGTFLALLCGAMSFERLGYDTQLATLRMSFNAMIAAIGISLTIFSLWRARSTSSTR